MCGTLGPSTLARSRPSSCADRADDVPGAAGASGRVWTRSPASDDARATLGHSWRSPGVGSRIGTRSPPVSSPFDPGIAPSEPDGPARAWGRLGASDRVPSLLQRSWSPTRVGPRSRGRLPRFSSSHAPYCISFIIQTPSVFCTHLYPFHPSPGLLLPLPSCSTFVPWYCVFW